MRRLGVLAAIIALLASAAAARGAPAPVRVVDLDVDGGEGWHRQDQFRLDWDFDGVGTVVAVHYRASATDGAVVAEQRIPWPAVSLDALRLREDGVYSVEVWAEDALGVASPAATAVLRLDRERPGAATPQLPAGWIAGSQAAHLRFSHPAGPPPPSGIRGYAVSVDTEPTGSPCAASEWCDEKETNMRAGIDDDLLTVPGLPEGTLYVHAVAVSGSGMRSSQVGTAIAHVDATPPRVTLEGVPAGWASGPVAVRAASTDALSGMAIGRGAFTAIAVDGGPPAVGRGALAGTVVSSDGVHRLTAFARDAAGNGAGEPSAAAAIRIDTAPPRVAFADPGDPDRVVAAVGDSGSGAAARGSIGFRPARSRQRFEPLPTAATAGRLTAGWDPTAHPAGTYEFQATGYDLAGNMARSSERANGSRMLIVNPRRTQTRIEARVGGRGGDLAAPFGRPIELRGTLSSANGAPLPGRQIELTEAFAAGGADRARVGTARTGADGGFSVRLAPGPNRRVEISFAGDRSLAPATATPVPVRVATRVTLSASSRRARIGGRPVVFRGRVGTLGAALPVGGLPVELQFRLPGLGWSEFRTVASDRRGRFRYPYAFADDDSRGARFQFRAVVAEQPGWPYAAGTSRAVSVTGH